MKLGPASTLPKVTCGECGAPMRLLTSKNATGPLQGRKFWGCTKYPDCTCTHGAHQSTGEPLGVPANAETRAARRLAHEAFDDLWAREAFKRNHGRPGQYLSRAAAYKWLASTFGRTEIHIGALTAEEAALVVKRSLAYVAQLANERRQEDQRRKAAGKRVVQLKGQSREGAAHRAAKLDRKRARQEARQPKQSEPPPPPEEPPKSWWQRAGALEVLASQEAGAIVLGEGVTFPVQHWGDDQEEAFGAAEHHAKRKLSGGKWSDYWVEYWKERRSE